MSIEAALKFLASHELVAPLPPPASRHSVVAVIGYASDSSICAANSLVAPNHQCDSVASIRRRYSSASIQTWNGSTASTSMS